MWPTIGALRTYIPIYILSMVTHLLVSLWLCKHNGLRKRVAFLLNVAYVLGMTVGARILYDILHDRLDWRNYLDIKYHFSDGLWGGPLAYLMVAVLAAFCLPRARTKLLDVIALSLPLPMIVAKIACFFNGCCYGADSAIPWALTFPEGAEAPGGVARHPTQLYEIVVLLVILAVFASVNRARWRGLLLAWFVLLYGLGRPLTEVFRDSAERVAWVGPFSSSQFVCLVAAGAAGVVLLARRTQRVAPPLTTTADL